MTACRRCQNIGVTTEAVRWVNRRDNEKWFVCEDCARAIEWANSRSAEFRRNLDEILNEIANRG